MARRKNYHLQDQYINLRRRLYGHLKGKDKPKEIICDVIASCVTKESRYQEVVAKLINEETITSFYATLTGFLSHLDFNGLLDELIYRCDDYELKVDAESYRRDLLTFLGHTSIKQAANANPPFWNTQDDHQHLPNFSKVRTKVLNDPATFRLIDLIACRMKFTSAIGLHQLIFLVLGIEELNSFVVSWLIPSTLVPILHVAVKSENVISVFQNYKISLLSVVTEEILYSVEVG